MVSHPRRSVHAVVVERGNRWNPWGALRERPHIVFALEPLPEETGGAVYCRRGARVAIVVDPALSLEERNAALAHELVHDELGGPVDGPGLAEGWEAVVARDEGRVANITAARLVPLGELASLLETLDDMGHAPDLWEIAEHFGVPDDVAGRALDLLQRQAYGERPTG